MGVESEGIEPPKQLASVTEELAGESVRDAENSAIHKNRTEIGIVTPGGNGADDSLNGGPPAKDGAQVVVPGSALGTGVHFLSVLLVFKNDGQVLGSVE